MKELIHQLRKEKPITFDYLSIPSALKILVLAPHPDDFDAIGITMHKLFKNGNDIYLVILTGGESGVEDEYAEFVELKDKAQIRRLEQIASIKFFGLSNNKLTFLKLENDNTGHMNFTDENYKILLEYWNIILPDIVFLPHKNDTNIDHQRTNIFFRKLTEVTQKQIVAFYNQDPKTISMNFDIYSPFDDLAANWKAELLRFHKSQHSRNLRTRGLGFDERILNVNKKIAETLKSGEQYLEVFEVEIF